MPSIATTGDNAVPVINGAEVRSRVGEQDAEQQPRLAAVVPEQERRLSELTLHFVNAVSNSSTFILLKNGLDQRRKLRFIIACEAMDLSNCELSTIKSTLYEYITEGDSAKKERLRNDLLFFYEF